VTHSIHRMRAAALLCAVAPLSFADRAQAQDAIVPEITITAVRAEQALQRTGSAVSVIGPEEIARSGARSVEDLLRQAPGVGVNSSGGPGQVQTVLLRGAEARHTLVLIDGVRMNDPSSTGGEVDFSNVVLDNVERIEILRGPQTALYGSDALGGVIQIITKKGQRQGHFGSAQIEGGAYGSKEGRVQAHGAQGPLFHSLGVSGFHADGFSAWGHRVARAGAQRLEADGARRFGADVNIGWKANADLTLEAGVSRTQTRAEFDSAFGAFPDGPGSSRSILTRGHARATHMGFDGLLRSQVSIYAAQTDRLLDSVYRYAPAPGAFYRSFYDYLGLRQGAEYQGELTLASFGKLTFGVRAERESAQGGSEDVHPFPFARTQTFDARQTTRSAYGMWSKSFGERLHLSLGGRVDDVSDSERFATWRATGAYNLLESGTKLRGSVGTGAKAPSLFQLFSEYGTPGLAPETSTGFDIGFDQKINAQLDASVTYFDNRFENLIDFSYAAPPCAAAQVYGCYYNVARARTRGVEVEGRMVLAPDALRLKTAYTHLHAVDADTGLALPRRPTHTLRTALEYRPAAEWLIEPRAYFVSGRWDRPGETNRLGAYLRIDAYGEKRLDAKTTVFARFENLTDVRYETVYGYGTAGRSAWLGLKTSW